MGKVALTFPKYVKGGMQKTFYAQICFPFDQVGAKLVKIPLISLGSTLLGATRRRKHQQKVMPELSSNNCLFSERTQVPQTFLFSLNNANFNITSFTIPWGMLLNAHAYKVVEQRRNIQLFSNPVIPSTQP